MRPDPQSNQPANGSTARVAGVAAYHADPRVERYVCLTRRSVQIGPILSLSLAVGPA